MVESILENFIADKFIKDESHRIIFIEFFLNNKDTTFSTKIEVFEKIINLNYPTKFDKSLINKIKNKKSLRNTLAHSNIRTVERNIGSNSLFFLKIEGQKIKHITYTNEDANRLINETHDLIFELQNYINTLET